MNTASQAPQWADSSRGLGRWIETLISIGLLRRPLFFQARQLIIRTAERNGIPWRARRQLHDAAASWRANCVTADLSIPEYYLARFHAYEQGNLCWQAAAEAEQATDAMALRVWPEEVMSPDLAQTRLQDAIHGAVAPLLDGSIEQVLDLGCSVGVSTQHLASWLHQRADDRQEPVRAFKDSISPLDMLAVARVRDQQGLGDANGAMRLLRTQVCPRTLDLISLQFVCHELPQEATHAVLSRGRTSAASWWCTGDGGSGPLRRQCYSVFPLPWPRC